MEARRIIDNILECDKPLIAAVQGYALGLGANVPLLFDVVVAGPDAKFGDTHVKMGIGAGDGGQLIWPFLIGVNRAKYYLMTGDIIGGKQAVEMGLAGFYADKTEDVLPKALEIATSWPQARHWQSRRPRPESTLICNRLPPPLCRSVCRPKD